MASPRPPVQCCHWPRGIIGLQIRRALLRDLRGQPPPASGRGLEGKSRTFTVALLAIAVLVLPFTGDQASLGDCVVWVGAPVKDSGTSVPGLSGRSVASYHFLLVWSLALP